MDADTKTILVSYCYGCYLSLLDQATNYISIEKNLESEENQLPEQSQSEKETFYLNLQQEQDEDDDDDDESDSHND